MLLVRRFPFLLAVLAFAMPVPPAPANDLPAEKVTAALPLIEKYTFSTLGQVPIILPILDGRFDGKVPPGVKRVEIGVYRPAKIPEDLVGAPAPPKGLMENSLPARYHAQSTLTATIGDTPMDLEFSLTLKP